MKGKLWVGLLIIGVAISIAGAGNVLELSAAIAMANEWQYIEAIYDAAEIKLVTAAETVSAPGIGPFTPNNHKLPLPAVRYEHPVPGTRC